MEVQFMTGANIFALVNLISALVMVYLVFRMWVKIANTTNPTYSTVRNEIVGIALIVFYLFFAGGVIQPKVAINTPLNYELEQYEEDKDVVITTPLPRTEKMDGFEPLKK